MRQSRMKLLSSEEAVSPVIGVMLMLVVTIIIAAVVSAFAGGLIGNDDQKAPKLTMDAKIVNTGYWQSSYFKAEVTGVDDPIDTRDLKIMTSWSKKLIDGTPIDGGATMVPGDRNFRVFYVVNGWSEKDNWTYVCPQGYGPGVGLSGEENTNFWPFEVKPGAPNYSKEPVLKASMAELEVGNLTNYSWFGNYNLQSGTIMFARPFGGRLGGQATGGTAFTVGYGMAADTLQGNTGGGRYFYSYGTDKGGATFEPYPESIDQMMAVLGNNWNYLRAGDVVTMKVIHTPSGKVIWQKDISVEG
jgi:hypothetical protein